MLIKLSLYISKSCCDQIICILITPKVGLDYVMFILYLSLWFWFIQTLFAGQTLHKVNNPTVWNLLSGHSQSIVMYLLTPFVFVSMKVLYHKTRQENQTFSPSGERKTNPSWENMIEISIVFFPDSNAIKWRTNRDILLVWFSDFSLEKKYLQY